MATRCQPHARKMSKTTLECTNMKKFLIPVLLIASFSVSSQTYTVIHSIGEIYDVTADRYISKGMKVSESSELRFDTPNARAAVLSSSRGRYIIQASKDNNGQSDLAYTLSSIISPVRGKLSTRAGGVNNALDFSKQFGEGPVAVVGERYEVMVSSTAYPMNDSQFFYVQYPYNGEMINKKLTGENDVLVFDASIYSIDGNPIDATSVGEMTLFYYNASKEESERLTSIALSWVSDEELKSIASNFDDPTSEESAKVIAEWINDLYGKCSVDQVIKGLNK